MWEERNELQVEFIIQGNPGPVLAVMGKPAIWDANISYQSAGGSPGYSASSLDSC